MEPTAVKSCGTIRGIDRRGFQLYRERGVLSDLVVGPNMQLPCLHLGFYLASWGMLRASCVLLQRSVKHYVPVIEVIASSPPEIWNVDAG